MKRASVLSLTHPRSPGGGGGDPLSPPAAHVNSGGSGGKSSAASRAGGGFQKTWRALMTVERRPLLFIAGFWAAFLVFVYLSPPDLDAYDPPAPLLARSGGARVQQQSLIPTRVSGFERARFHSTPFSRVFSRRCLVPLTRRRQGLWQVGLNNGSGCSYFPRDSFFLPNRGPLITAAGNTAQGAAPRQMRAPWTL